MKKYKYLPDMSVYPDCQERREIENLAAKLELKMSDMVEDKENLEKYSAECNEIWWTINAKMGALVDKKNQLLDKSLVEKKINKRWIWTTIIAGIALILSIVQLILKMFGKLN